MSSTEDLVDRFLATGVLAASDIQPGASATGEHGVGRERFDLLQPIGSGAMGQVFRAYDRHLELIVAVKRLSCRFQDRRRQAQAALRLHQEAKLLARLDHPGIPKVYDAGWSASGLYIAMELVEGESLEARRRRERLPAQRALSIIEEAASIMQYAHDRGIIHRDLKPAHILLEQDGRVRLIDFGIARDLRQDLRLTQPGMLLGTFAYMAPEQLQGRSHEVDARSDVFSLGAVLYELLAGEPPFAGEDFGARTAAMGQAEPAPLRGFSPGTANRLNGIMRQALAQAPAGRFPSASALAEALGRARRCMDETWPVQQTASNFLKPLPERHRGRRLLSGLGAVALAGLLAFAGLLALAVRAWASDARRPEPLAALAPAPSAEGDRVPPLNQHDPAEQLRAVVRAHEILARSAPDPLMRERHFRAAQEARMALLMAQGDAAKSR